MMEVVTYLQGLVSHGNPNRLFRTASWVRLILPALRIRSQAHPTRRISISTFTPACAHTGDLCQGRHSPPERSEPMQGLGITNGGKRVWWQQRRPITG